jgi:uncharacterized protein (TIGR00369 family)
MNADLVTFARAHLARQRFAMMLGTELVAISPGHAELALAITDDLRQQHGFVHGGVIAYLADNALTFAGGSVLGDALTVEMKLNYLRPAAGAGRLVAVAHVVGHGTNQAVVRCDVFVEAEGLRKLCAAAQGTIRRAGVASAGGPPPGPPTTA